MKYPVFLSEQADRDIRGIFEYIAFTKSSPMNAESVFKRITKAILSLSELPERTQIFRMNKSGETVRFLVCGNHNLYFNVDRNKGCVYVIRVLYGGMDIDKELDLWI